MSLIRLGLVPPIPMLEELLSAVMRTPSMMYSGSLFRGKPFVPRIRPRGPEPGRFPARTLPPGALGWGEARGPAGPHTRRPDRIARGLVRDPAPHRPLLCRGDRDRSDEERDDRRDLQYTRWIFHSCTSPSRSVWNCDSGRV